MQWPISFILPLPRAADDGGAGGSGDPGAPGGSGAADPAEGPAWATGLKGSIEEMTGVMKQMMTTAERVRGEQQQPATPAAEEPEDEEEDPTDLEVLSRKDFGSLIVRQVLKAVNKQVVEPINNQIREMTAATTRNQIQGSVKELAEKHKDFWDWKDEMLALANENRGLAPQRLYQLARADNATKAAELDKKYAPPPRDGGGPIRFKGFGGMTPSQSGSGSRSSKMNGSDAATAAWAETVAALGGEPMFEE